MSNLQARTSRSFTGVGGLLHCGSIWMLMGDYSCSTRTPPAPTTQGDTELYHGDLKEADAGSMSDRETCLQYRVGQGSRELALLLTCIPLVKGSGKRGSLNFQIAEAGEDFTKWGIFRDGVSMLLPNTADLQGMDGEKKSLTQHRVIWGMIVRKCFPIFPLRALEKDKVLTLRITVRKHTTENHHVSFAFFICLGQRISSLIPDFCCSLICFLSTFCMWKSLCVFEKLISTILCLKYKLGHFYLDTQLFPSYCFCLPVSMGLEMRYENLNKEPRIQFHCL